MATAVITEKTATYKLTIIESDYRLGFARVEYIKGWDALCRRMGEENGSCKWEIVDNA